MMVNGNSNNQQHQQLSQQQQQQQLQQQQHQQNLNQHQLSLVGHNLNNANQLLLNSLTAMPNLLNNSNALNSNLVSGTQSNQNMNAGNNGSNNDLTLTSLINSTNSNQNANSVASNGSNGNTGLLDLIMCKLVAPFHVVNDPRLLECGSSACYQCIMSTKDNERNLKCPYCNNVHKIPADSNKLIQNKNLQNFLKNNSRQLNSNFSKQLEDSMFALEQKIHSQNLSMENFDQYLTLMQNDVQMKVDTMKSYLEKYGQHFIDNLKSIRKEVQKKFQTCCKEYESRFNVYRQWIEHTNQNTNVGNNSTLNMNSSTSNKNKSFSNLGLKPDLSNNNVMSGLNSNHTTYQLNSFNNNLTGSSNNHHATGNLNHNDNKRLSNNQSNNFSNTSWNPNDDDLDDFDGELNIKSSHGGSGAKRHLNKEQAQFNKFVREEVAKKFGDDFLLRHEVNQLESSIMDIIKNEAVGTFLPKDTTPARAWTLAKVSLRSLKRDLRRKQGIAITPSSLKKDSNDSKLVSHPYFDI